MALVLKDRVRVRTRSSGTGTITLENTITGYQDFSAIGNGNETYFGIVDAVGNWEVVRGFYSSIGPTLTRDTVVDSSNGGALVDFPVGSKTVFCTFPSSLAQIDLLGALGIGNFSFYGNNIDTADATPITVQQTTTFVDDVVVNGNLTFGGTLSGNTLTATALETARLINGVSFNGTADITVPADAGTLSNDTLNSGVIYSSLRSVDEITSGTWSANFGTVSGFNLTNINSANLTGTIAPAVLGNSALYVGTTEILLNRGPAIQLLQGTSITGNAGTASALETSKNINGVAFNGAIDITVPADASTLTNTTLNATVVNSSLTSVGTLTALTVNDPVHRIVPFLSKQNGTIQTISPAIDTRITFDTVFDSLDDTGLLYNSTTFNGRFTNKSGETRVYNLSTTVNFEFNNTGSRAVWFEKQGVNVSKIHVNSVDDDITAITVSTTMKLDDNDWFEVHAYQSTGVNLDTGNPLTGNNFITITWI